MWGTSQGFGADVTDELASALAGLKRPLVLEVGIGSRRNAPLALANSEARLVGLGLSREMLQRTKTKIKPFKKDVPLIQADAEYV